MLSNGDGVKLTNPEKTILKNIRFVLKVDKNLASFDKKFLFKVRELVEEGSLPKNRSKTIANTLNNLPVELKRNPIEIIGVLRDNIDKELLKTDSIKDNGTADNFKEIILSEYFIKGE